MLPPATTKLGTPLTSRLGNLSHQVSSIATPAPSPLAVPDVSAEVLSTTDYDLFNTIDANRPVVEAHVRFLMEQIQQKDMLHLRPLDVDASFGVIDGQHRLEAARRLGKPVYYRIGQLTDEDMATLNRASRNWKSEDYLHYWASKGKAGYQLLATFLQQHPQLGLTTALTLLSVNQGYSYAQFRDGIYRAGDMQQAVEVATFIEQVRTEANYKYARDSRFVLSVFHCLVKCPGFELNTFLRKILLQPTELVRCATQKQYMVLFDRIYNYKTTDKFKVLFR